MLRLDTILEILLYSAALLGYLPLVPHLQKLPAIAIPVAIIFSLAGSRRGLFLQDRPALFVSLGLFTFYLLQFSRHNMVVPAANMLAIFLAIRLAGVKSPRNFLQTVTLSLFCLAASSLFDLGPRFVIYLFLMLVVITVALVLLVFRSSAPECDLNIGQLRAVLKIALLQPLLALPLALLLFFILPRTQFPLWQGLVKAGSDSAGLSDSVQPGDKSSISSSGAVVFRAEMAPLPADSLYWRGMVLNSLQGNSWVRRQPPTAELPTVRGGNAVHQTIFLEPGKHPFLPALDPPLKISGFRGASTADQLFPAVGLYNRRRTYDADSLSGGHIAATRIDRVFYTGLPDNVPPQLRAMAVRASAGGGSGKQRLARLEKAFMDLNLSYGSSGLPTGPGAIDIFLFKDKKGHCELFATSFALALRLAGVPARLVGGYYGGDYNELAGYYVVSAEKAHVWVEAWLDDGGWVVVDPSRFAVNFAETTARQSSTLRLRLSLVADTLSYYWNRLIINYDLESQFSAASSSALWLRSFSHARPSLRLLALVGGLMTAAVAAYYLLGRRHCSAEELLLRSFARKVKAAYGIVISPAAGLHETLRGVDDPAIKRFVTIYSGAVYRDRQLTPEETALLRSLLRELGKKRVRLVTDNFFNDP